VVRVDHLALTYLTSLKNSANAKFQRHALLLPDFQFKVEYKKGKTRTLADSLSRKPFSEEEKKQAEQIEAEVGLGFLSSFTNEYLSEIQPSQLSILKSHSRHSRRHAKILHFAPITLQDVTDPPAPNDGEQQQPRTSTADNAEAVELPTFDHII
jgi:hypothetical protein